MGVGSLTIYSASAGSGKTYTLAGVYLEKLFQSRYNYRKILAVTFTHKATAEMKSRILDELDNLAAGRPSKYLSQILVSTGRNESEIRKEAGEILHLILHDYSRFSVSTIDSFFQKILRTFTRDIGLRSGFNVELDHTVILPLAVNRMIESVSADPALRKWLSGFIRSNIEDEKSWDISKNIISLSNQLFSEKFRLVPREVKQKFGDKDFLLSYIKEINTFVSDTEAETMKLGEKCLTFIDRFNLTDVVFYYKGKGIPYFVKAMASGIVKMPNRYTRAIEDNPPKWSSGPLPGNLEKAIKSGLDESLKEAIRFCDTQVPLYKSANVILSNIYTLGILSDVLTQIRNISEDENIFLLSDTGELIYLITSKDQAPFIYEKVGNAIDNFMIDEFQDTSVIQWKNFGLLIDNSMSQGFDSLVVGDVKQSIYRWRNSSWETFRDLRRASDNERLISRPLGRNWRSCKNIIRFNNELFSIIPEQLDNEFNGNISESVFSELYSEAWQDDPGNKGSGYVRLEFIGDSETSCWEDSVLEKLPEVIESILKSGYNPSDIGILVRENREGAQVLRKIIGHASALPETEKSKFNIVSSDSLLLANAPVIRFIISVFQVLHNPGNMIEQAIMLKNYLHATGKRFTEDITIESENLSGTSDLLFPEGYNEFLDKVRYLTLWDISERTIQFFDLGSYSYNVAYLNSFQDIVMGFMSGKNPGIASFLEWWGREGCKKSVPMPEQRDAIRVLTIHKAKGLEFEVVILPFLSWNLDHKPNQTNILWVRPEVPPFDKLGIVPVRYTSALSETIFAGEYYKEKYYAYVDNLNLLYVALTRAKNAIYGFAPLNPRADNRISMIIRDALEYNGTIRNSQEVSLYRYFNPDSGIFEIGDIPAGISKPVTSNSPAIIRYTVNDNVNSLRLRLHWEHFPGRETDGKISRIRQGKLMHEIFEGLKTIDDVDFVVRQKVLEGKLTENEEEDLRLKIRSKLMLPVVKDWFDPRNEVLNEVYILLPGAGTKRPDRIVLRDGNAIIVDFKFGEKNPHYISQVKQYKDLLVGMGYTKAEAYLWYVDSEEITTV